jgi:hypothetical protein
VNIDVEFMEHDWGTVNAMKKSDVRKRALAWLVTSIKKLPVCTD